MSRSIKVDASGPLFSPEAMQLGPEFVRDFEDQYGQEGVKRVRAQLKKSLQHPTGRYSRGVRTSRATGSNVVTDNRAVYGPWLEGTGSRNKTTRFKGYRTFRIVAQQMDRDAAAFAENLFKANHLGRVD